MATPSVFVNVLCTPQENWQWDNLQFSALHPFGGLQLSTGSVNAEASFDFYAEDGTYTLDVFHSTGSTRGIYTVQLDEQQVATVDGYAASGAPTKTPLAGLTISGTGTHRLRFLMATKNASASTYVGAMSGLYLTRTGA